MAAGILLHYWRRLFADDLPRLTPAEPHGEGKGEQILEQCPLSTSLGWLGSFRVRS